MSLVGIRDAIKTALATVSPALANVYDNAPDSIPSDGLPAAIILPTRGRYHEDFSGQMGHDIEVILLVAQLPGLSASAQEALDAYLVESGTASIAAAVEVATLSTHGDDIQVRGYRDYGILTWRGVDYLGCRFDVTVWT